MVRLAFTLIELIFAIVVIGITVVSLPMMSQVTATGIDENIVQEAIFAAATELNEATTYHWDESSFDANASNIYSRVVTTALGGAKGCDAASRLRPGHINQELHRRCTQSDTAVSNATADANISSFNDVAHNGSGDYIFNDTVTDAAGYKKVYTSSLSVTNPVSFGALSNSNDIKKIEVIVSDPDGVVTKLSAYSANIGEIDYYKRTMP
jgi:hypothetical protein